jgi:hypothetical protein
VSDVGGDALSVLALVVRLAKSLARLRASFKVHWLMFATSVDDRSTVVCCSRVRWDVDSSFVRSFARRRSHSGTSCTI